MESTKIAKKYQELVFISGGKAKDVMTLYNNTGVDRTLNFLRKLAVNGKVVDKVAGYRDFPAFSSVEKGVDTMRVGEYTVVIDAVCNTVVLYKLIN